LFDHPLRDSAVGRGPDGTYYLTGTSGSKCEDGTVDFETNDGIWLWKSQDLKTWEPLGQVWSISRDPQRFGNPHYGNPSGGQMSWRASQNPGRNVPVRGMISPEIHFVQGKVFIPYSINGYGTGLLVSETGKAEGPYRDIGKITRTGNDPSLFEDQDGKVYWVWGEGWIAQMNEALDGLAEEPRLMSVRPEVAGGTWPGRIGTGGAFLFRAPAPGMEQGEYHLVGTERIGRMGPMPVYDTYIATSTSVYGPYQRRDVMVPHGGQSTVFQGPSGEYFATFNGMDPWASVRDRPAIVPLVPHATEHGAPYWWGGAFIKPWYPVTEAGAWSEMEPLVQGRALRDVSILNAPDGYYYLTATDMGERQQPREQVGLRVWRSTDRKNWEDQGLLWRCNEDPKIAELLTRVRSLDHGRGLDGLILFDPEMHFLKGNYWLLVAMRTRALWAEPDGMQLLLLRSESGTPAGPYKQHWKGPHTPDLWTPSLLEDTDGKVYIVGGGVGNRFAPLTDDLSDLAGPIREISPTGNHSVGEGGHLIKVGDHYIFTSAAWHGADPYDLGLSLRGRLFSTYDLMATSAKSLNGPWSRTWCIAPKCGNSRPFQDKEGQWWTPFFGNHFFGPWQEMPGLFPLELDSSRPDAPLRPRGGNPQ
jgi:beta-xylosidase